MTITITRGGHTYSATVDHDIEAEAPLVTIRMDGHWAGDGVLLESGRIADCAAQLGETPDDTEDIYEALETAIAEVN